MNLKIEQGNILKIEGINDPVLVLSTNYYNSNNRIIVCPVVKSAKESILNVNIQTKEVEGVALCDQLKSLNINIRGHKIIGKIDTNTRILISDIVQGLFDYI